MSSETDCQVRDNRPDLTDRLAYACAGDTVSSSRSIALGAQRFTFCRCSENFTSAASRSAHYARTLDFSGSPDVPVGA